MRKNWCFLHIGLNALFCCGLLGWAAFGASVSPAQDNAQPPIRLYAFHRPPYYSFDGPAPAGFLLELSKSVLEAANIPYIIQEMPPQRILEQIKSNQERACSPGWFLSPEREEFALFTDPLYVNAPMGAALRAESLYQIPARPTVKQLLRSGLILGLKSGFSYGEVLDEQLLEYKDRAYVATIDNEQFLRMIAKSRIDFAFMEPEEYSWLVQKTPELAATLRFLTPSDAPSGQSRRLMCSKALGQETLQAINTALSKVKAGEGYRRLLEQPFPEAAPKDAKQGAGLEKL